MKNDDIEEWRGDLPEENPLLQIPLDTTPLAGHAYDEEMKRQLKQEVLKLISKAALPFVDAYLEKAMEDSKEQLNEIDLEVIAKKVIAKLKKH